LEHGIVERDGQSKRSPRLFSPDLDPWMDNGYCQTFWNR
jgi:hypothetical protein